MQLERTTTEDDADSADGSVLGHRFSQDIKVVEVRRSGQEAEEDDAPKAGGTPAPAASTDP